MACKIAGGISYFDGILLILIQVTALFGNGLFFVGIFRFAALRNVTNILLCCLALADIVVTLGPMTITFALYICSWGDWSEFTKKAYAVTDIWCGTVSILSLTVIAMDRYFAIEWPFVHQRVVKKGFAICTVLTVWLISAISSAVRLIPTVPRKPLTLANILISFGIPLIIMSFCYVNIAIIARRQTIRIAQLNAAGASIQMRYDAENASSNNSERGDSSDNRTDQANGEQSKGVLKNISMLRRGTLNAYTKMKAVGRELKAAKTLGIVMGAFIVAWTPFMSLNIISYIHCNPPGAKCYELLTPTLVKYVKFLHYFSSALNPCLYVLLNKKWRDAFKHMLRCRHGSRLSSESRSSLAAGW